MKKASFKEQLRKDIDRDLRAKARQKLDELRAALRMAKVRRREGRIAVRLRCRAERLALRERCRADYEAASSLAPVLEARAKLAEEQSFQRSMRRIERANRERRLERPTVSKAVRRSESDDEVRQNIDSSLIPLFERLKGWIKGGPRKSRTEEFLEYAERNPGEVFEAMEAGLDAQIREMERRANKAARAMKAGRYRQALAAAADEVPF